MGNSLKVFFGILILIGMVLYIVFLSPFAAVFFGLGPFVTKAIIVIALIAGVVTLLIKVIKVRR
jgi:hypothetical protein